MLFFCLLSGIPYSAHPPVSLHNCACTRRKCLYTLPGVAGLLLGHRGHCTKPIFRCSFKYERFAVVYSHPSFPHRPSHAKWLAARTRLRLRARGGWSDARTRLRLCRARGLSYDVLMMMSFSASSTYVARAAGVPVDPVLPSLYRAHSASVPGIYISRLCHNVYQTL